MRRWISALLLLAGLLGPLDIAAAQTSGPTYVVQEGDTLFGIAASFGVSVEELAAANGITDPSMLFPGTSLIIPGFEEVSGVLTSRPISYGETLASLAIRSGVPEDVLIRLNHIVNPTRLYVGQPVIAPVAVENPAALAVAALHRVARAEAALGIAVQRGVNPWVAVAHLASTPRLWSVPGETLVVPGGDTPVSGLAEPVLSVSVLPERGVQGKVEVIRVQLSSEAWVEGSLGAWPLHFYPLESGERVALQGVNAMTEPGMIDLELRILDAEGGSVVDVFSQPVRVASGDYPFDQPLLVPPETLDPAVTGPEEELVLSIVGASSPERLWDGPFQFPSLITDSFPSRFGSRRSYNGMGYNWYHTGLDFYGNLTTEVLSPAPGRVVFAGPLTVRGNTIFVDHGWGVFTAYLHQSEIRVAVGDLVEAGQVIGVVGATGRVTGPHLHWEVWVGGVPVDPLDWVANTYP